jgi:hypothetical protein
MHIFLTLNMIKTITSQHAQNHTPRPILSGIALSSLRVHLSEICSYTIVWLMELAESRPAGNFLWRPKRSALRMTVDLEAKHDKVLTGTAQAFSHSRPEIENLALACYLAKNYNTK